MITAVVIVAPSDAVWVDATTQILRRRSLQVVRLEALAIIGFLLTARKITTVFIDVCMLPLDWDGVRDRMLRISPNTEIVVVRGGDAPNSLAFRVGRFTDEK